MASRVFVYGVPARLNAAQVQQVAEVDEQLWLAHRLREDLVAIEHHRQDRLNAVWSSVPEIAEIETALEVLDEEIAGLAKAAAKERSQRRARGVTAGAPTLAGLRARRKDLKACRKELIGQVREQRGGELTEIGQERDAAIKATYAQYCQVGIPDRDTGQPKKLYWATYNDVAARHKVAATRVQAVRAQGRAAQLRHHRFDGSGTVSVQLQRQSGDPQRTPATIADPAGKWRNVLHLPGWVDPEVWAVMPRSQQRRDRLALARLNVGEGRTVQIPVIVHRMLPAEADITGARIVVRRVASRTKTELHLTVNLPGPDPVDREPSVALHLGWRRDPDTGDVAVATWRSTHPVQVPTRLDARIAPGGPVRPDTDRSGRIVLTARWLARIAHQDAVRAERDEALNKVRDRVVDWLGRYPGGLQWRDKTLTPAVVAAWRAPGRFAVLAMDWRDQPPDGGEDIAVTLEQWRRWDKKRWEAEANGRMGALDHRTDTYRVVVAWLTGFAGKLVVDDTDLSVVARRPNPERDPDLPTVVEQRAAHQRTLAAVGRLREIACDTAGREGVAVHKVPHAGITRTHYRCGHVNPADDRYAASVVVPCDGCGQSYDQDSSATLLMLAAAGYAPPAGTA